MPERTEEMDQAIRARDALIAQLRFGVHPHPTVVGIGISRENGEYVVSVSVLKATDLPSEVLGVPVRTHRAGPAIAYSHA